MIQNAAKHRTTLTMQKTPVQYFNPALVLIHAKTLRKVAHKDSAKDTCGVNTRARAFESTCARERARGR